MPPAARFVFNGYPCFDGVTVSEKQSGRHMKFEIQKARGGHALTVGDLRRAVSKVNKIPLPMIALFRDDGRDSSLLLADEVLLSYSFPRRSSLPSPRCLCKDTFVLKLRRAPCHAVRVGERLLTALPHDELTSVLGFLPLRALARLLASARRLRAMRIHPTVWLGVCGQFRCAPIGWLDAPAKGGELARWSLRGNTGKLAPPLAGAFCARALRDYLRAKPPTCGDARAAVAALCAAAERELLTPKADASPTLEWLQCARTRMFKVSVARVRPVLCDESRLDSPLSEPPFTLKKGGEMTGERARLSVPRGASRSSSRATSSKRRARRAARTTRATRSTCKPRRSSSQTRTPSASAATARSACAST